MSLIQSRFAPFFARTMALVVGGVAVLASAPAFASTYGGIKVECWGNCSIVNLGQVCDSFSPGSIPISVACDDTANPGAGWRETCGGGATCTPYGGYARSDLLSAYCQDGAGNDAIVSCMAP